MYLSHPVRRMRDDPTPDETTDLVVDLADDASPAALEATVSDLGGRLEEELRFSIRITLPESELPALCDSELVARIETADTLGYGITADVAPETEPDEKTEDT